MTNSSPSVSGRNTPPPLFSTAYCPPVAYFAALLKHSAVQIEVCETYPKQTYRNRAIILSPNGVLPLTVPIILTQGNHTLTRDAGISYAEHWNVKHWRTITTAYNASPYFLYYQDKLKSILLTPHERLIDLNNQLMRFLLRALKIETTCTPTQDFIPVGTVDNDYRYTFSPKDKSTGQHFPAYSQVFSNQFPFVPNLSILDVLFNLGPQAKDYLLSL